MSAGRLRTADTSRMHPWLSPLGAALGMRGRAQPWLHTIILDISPSLSAAHLAGITRKGERGLLGYTRRCQTDDTHLAMLSRFRYPRFPPPIFCMRIRPLTTPPTPTGRAAATKSTRHEFHEVRPGALTRPRRLCPTSDGTPKQPPRVSRCLWVTTDSHSSAGTWNTALVGR